MDEPALARANALWLLALGAASTVVTVLVLLAATA